MATPRDAKFPADPADGMARSDPTNEYPNGCTKSQYFSVASQFEICGNA